MVVGGGGGEILRAIGPARLSSARGHVTRRNVTGDLVRGVARRGLGRDEDVVRDVARTWSRT